MAVAGTVGSTADKRLRWSVYIPYFPDTRRTFEVSTIADFDITVTNMTAGVEPYFEIYGPVDDPHSDIRLWELPMIAFAYDTGGDNSVTTRLRLADSRYVISVGTWASEGTVDVEIKPVDPNE